MKRSPMRSMICPECSRELTGDPSCDVFFCHPCARAYPLNETDVRGYPLSYLRPIEQIVGTPVWAPFWEMEAECTIAHADQRQRETWSRTTPWKHIFLPAFWSPAADSLPHLTASMGLVPSAKIRREHRHDPIYRPTRSTKNLERIARLLLIQHLDRARDVTGAVIHVRPLGYSFTGVPFFRIPHRPGWINALTGESYPANLLP